MAEDETYGWDDALDLPEQPDVERYREDAELAAQASPEDRQRYLDSLRKQAAIMSNIADGMGSNAATLPDLQRRTAQAMPGIDLSGIETLRSMMSESAQQTRLLGEVQAAQAVAYQELLDGGGPENVEAYARYAEACRRHTALLSQDDMRHEDTGGG